MHNNQLLYIYIYYIIAWQVLAMVILQSYYSQYENCSRSINNFIGMCTSVVESQKKVLTAVEELKSLISEQTKKHFVIKGTAFEVNQKCHNLYHQNHAFFSVVATEERAGTNILSIHVTLSYR